MSFRFLIDNQLPRALGEWIRQQGYQAEHVLELNLAQAKDNPIWLRAQQDGSLIVTKDEDYAEWVRRGRAGPSVVWIRVGNCSRRTLLAWIAPLWPTVIRRLEEGARLVEVR